MKKPYALLWGFVLLLSLSLVVLMMRGAYPHNEIASPSPTLLPSETAPALILAPTPFLSTVVPPPTQTPLPSPLPTMTAFVVTQGAPAPRVFNLLGFTSDQSSLSSYCNQLGSPVGLSIYDWTSGTTVSLSDQAIAEIPLGWDASSSIWQGYQSQNPLNQPGDTSQHWDINLFLPDSSEHWINILTSPQTPNVDYVYTYQRITAFSDAQGQHYGVHPCRVFTITPAQMQNFLNVVAQFQNAVHYPAFIDGDDPRWQRGIASPLSAYTDLRSIPSDSYNDPIGSIVQATTLWYARDSSWKNWAQVKIGAVQGWIDMKLVKITPAS